MVAFETSKLFGCLSSAELQTLERQVQWQTLAGGDAVFQEGDPGDGMYLIHSGQIEVSAMVSPTERRVLARFGPGDFFGEMAVLDDGARSATASAKEDSSLCFIPRKEMLRMLGESPKLALRLVREFSLRLREFDRQYIREVVQAEKLALVGKFARSIVHDFKNPLNIIGISAELAAQESASFESRRTAKDRIYKQIDRLGVMISELLEFTRGDQTLVALAPLDYAHFVKQVIDDIRAELEAKAIVIEFENPPPKVQVPMDPKRLTHVFFNLLHNAADAMMPEGGTIRLRFRLDAHTLVTEIEDSGPGIAPEILSHLFEAFATFGKAQGTGLGLSICKKIVTDHDGTISAHSEPGHGAIFAFSLPVATDSLPAGP